MSGGEIQTVGCDEESHRGMRADVQSARSRVVCGCEMIEIMERSGGEI